MSEAVLVIEGESWSYTACDGDAGMRVNRSVSAGLASPCGHFVRLGSLKSFQGRTGMPGLRAALMALEGDGIFLVPNEKLCFGRKEDSFAHDGANDLSLSECPTRIGVKLRPRDLEDEEIVQTLWPSSGRALPARVRRVGKRVCLDLAEEQGKGERCFVFDDGWNWLVTASLPVEGDGLVEAIPHCSIGTWLCLAGSKSASWMPDRFAVGGSGGFFTVEDAKTGHKYRGRLKSDKEEIRGMERDLIGRRLASGGIGALIPAYKLANADRLARGQG